MAHHRRQVLATVPVVGHCGRGRLWQWIIIAVVLGTVGLWWFTVRPGARKVSTIPPARSQSRMRAFQLEDERAVFGTYSGSAACRDCHTEAYDSWAVSNHGLAERPPQSDLDQSAFDPPRTFRHGTQESFVAWQEGKPQVVCIGLSGQPEAHLVARVIGHDPVRQFLVPFGGGRFQTLEASYDPRTNEWFNAFGNEDRRPGEWGHWTGRGMSWNAMCASCHNTRLRKNYDEATDTYHTTMAERTVGCEACHGPLKAHVDWQARFAKSGQKDPTVSKLAPNQLVDSCGFCHARRVDLTGDFKPGDAFLDHEELVLVGHNDQYYADGQVHDEDYEYGSFLSSRMHFRGVICLDCHNAHSAKTMLPGNWLCMRCHNGSYTNAPVIAPVSHSHHQVFGYNAEAAVTNSDLMQYKPREIKETGGECVNCHMPQTVYMQRHWRHDHGFTIPDPLLTKELGIPNACNRCHKDKETNWALHAVDQWYGPKMDRPSRTRARWIAQGRIADPGAQSGLLQLLDREESPYWRAVAAGLLQAWSAEAPISDALLRHLQDTNALVRSACIRALEPVAIPSWPRVVQGIRERLDDPVRNVRVAAAWTLRSSLAADTRAASELKHTLDLNADQPTGQLQKGIYYLARHESDAALQHLQKAVAWDPGSTPFRHELAVVLSALHRPAEAIEQLQAACRLTPLDAEMHFQLGLAYDEQGDLRHAADELTAAVQLDSHHARAWYNLGLAQNELGNSTTAVESLLRAESIESRDAQIPYARATILARLARPEEARVAVLRALELHPEYPEARELLELLSR